MVAASFCQCYYGDKLRIPLDVLVVTGPTTQREIREEPRTHGVRILKRRVGNLRTWMKYEHTMLVASRTRSGSPA